MFAAFSRKLDTRRVEPSGLQTLLHKDMESRDARPLSLVCLEFAFRKGESVVRFFAARFSGKCFFSPKFCQFFCFAEDF